MVLVRSALGRMVPLISVPAKLQPDRSTYGPVRSQFTLLTPVLAKVVAEVVLEGELVPIELIADTR